MAGEVYINGRFVPYSEASVPIDDRGFQFAESVYEVIRAYDGRPFEMARHMRRMKASAAAFGIDLEDEIANIEQKTLELIERNGMPDCLIYVQVTSGNTPRAHHRPSGLKPTVVIIVSPFVPIPESKVANGLTLITVPDDRWASPYVKTTMLLPNTRAKLRAATEGADDAIFVRDGFVTEATAANVFAVFSGTLYTAPASNYILHGITREVALEVARDLGIPTVEAPIPAARIYSADEVMLTGTASEMISVCTLDGKKIGSGRPGPVCARIVEALRRRAKS